MPSTVSIRRAAGGARVLACAAVLLLPALVAGQPAAEAVRAIEPSQALDRIRSVSVLVRRSAPLIGSEPNVGGFAIAAGRIATAVSTLDATDSVEFLWPSGAMAAVSGVAALDREQGWALLAHGSTGPEPLPRARTALAARDRCFVLGRGENGNEFVAKGVLAVGRRPGSLPGCVAEFSGAARPVPGAPILNASGEAAGIAGTWMPQGIGPLHRVLALDATSPVGLSTPVIPLPPLAAGQDARAVSLDVMRAQGTVLAPVVTGYVERAGFSHELLKRAPPFPTGRPPYLDQARRDPSSPIDECDVFVRGSVPSLFVFLNWTPATELEGEVRLRGFDDRNALVLGSSPTRAKLKKGKSVFQAWEVPLPRRAGDYRIEVLVGPTVYWRSYATVLDREPSTAASGAPVGSRAPAAPSAAHSSDAALRPPQKLVDVQAAYPRAAQKARVQGMVVIDATIDVTGEVMEARVQRSIPPLDEAALDAVRRWRFTPTLLDGVPVPVTLSVMTRFSLR